MKHNIKNKNTVSKKHNSKCIGIRNRRLLELNNDYTILKIIVKVK